MVACFLKMSGREGLLAILLDKSVEHYDLAWNRLSIDLNDIIVRAADVLGCDCRGSSIDVRSSYQAVVHK